LLVSKSKSIKHLLVFGIRIRITHFDHFSRRSHDVTTL